MGTQNEVISIFMKYLSSYGGKNELEREGNFMEDDVVVEMGAQKFQNFVFGA